MTAGAAGEPLYGRGHELQVVAGLVGGLRGAPVASSTAGGTGSLRRFWANILARPDRST